MTIFVLFLIEAFLVLFAIGLGVGLLVLVDWYDAKRGGPGEAEESEEPVESDIEGVRYFRDEGGVWRTERRGPFWVIRHDPESCDLCRKRDQWDGSGIRD